MENELDLTLRLGLPNPTVETHLSLNSTLTSDQGINVENGGESFSLRRMIFGDDEVIDDDEGARNNVNVNIRMYNYIFEHFAGVGETLNFAPYPMPPSLSPAPAPANSTVSDYVLIDVPAKRAQRNKSLATANALNANTSTKWLRRCGRGCGGCSVGERMNVTKKCTNMNCNAISTPMWRRGPLGPKTLCNACGIKFRKEEERKSKTN